MDEVLVDVLHAVGGQLLMVRGVQITGGDDDVGVHVIPVFMDGSLYVHVQTSSGWQMCPATPDAAATEGEAR